MSKCTRIPGLLDVGQDGVQRHVEKHPETVRPGGRGPLINASM
jgi:hypothetical protein